MSTPTHDEVAVRPIVNAHKGRVVVMKHSKPVFPLGVSNYEAMCTTPGTVLVDKSRYVSAMLSQFSKRGVNIIHAPKGFGKTTFLSTLSAYFDVLTPHAHFAPDVDCNIGGRVSAARNRLLVFNLDLSRIDWHTDMDSYLHYEKCCLALDEAACSFYARYRALLRPPNSKNADAGFDPTFSTIINRARALRWGVFLAVDNYNAVVHDDSYGVSEESISRFILDRLASAFMNKLFSYGLIMGETMADASSWLRLPTIFADVTESDELKEAFGFTMDEVGALGTTLALDLQAELAPIWMGLDLQEGERVLYCPSDVLSMARDMLEGRHSGASADFRFVALEPVRPPTPADNQMLFGDPSEPCDLMSDDCEPELPDYQMLEEDDDESDEPMPEVAPTHWRTALRRSAPEASTSMCSLR